MKDRIKLAEAMGWTPNRTNEKWTDPATGTSGNRLLDLPDPFTDANDDYAVLEWMRENLTITQRYKFLDENVQNYRIGDYARAALKALT